MSVVRGTYYPEKLFLDEIALNGTVSEKTTLKDDGVLPDAFKGDQIYTGELMLSSVMPEEKSYSVRAFHQTTPVSSGVGRFWVSGCPTTARPSNPNKIIALDDGGSSVFANEILVTLTSTVPQDLNQIKEILKDVKGEVVGCIPTLRQYLVEIPTSADPEELKNQLYVAIATLQSKPSLIAEATPNAAILTPEQENATACDGQCQWYLSRIRAPEAWALVGGGDEQMGVGLIDFGVDCLLSDVKCVLDTTAEYNYSNDAAGRDHGTGVASLIGAHKAPAGAATENLNQMVGVAWNTGLHPYSVQKAGGSQYKMSELITRSTTQSNIRVINISAAVINNAATNNATNAPPDKLLEAMCSAIATGRLIVVAAGNATAAKNCQWSDIYPAAYNNNSTQKCANGADLSKGLLVVGSIDADNNLAEWNGEAKLCSNTLYVDLFAPGKDIYTTSTNTTSTAGADGKYYGTKNGTSFSAPLVAGAAAVLWAAKPSMTVAELHDQLINSSAIFSKSAKLGRNKTQDPRMEGQRVLDLFAAAGGKDAIIPPKLVPDPFIFAPRTNTEHNTLITSAPVTITGIEAAVPVSITGGFYSIDRAPFTSAAGTISPNQTLQVQVLSSTTPLASSEVKLTVGPVTQAFEVATAAVVTAQPTSFNFNDVVNAGLNTSVLSNTLGIAGLANGTPISIVGGEYSIAGGAFTSARGTVNANQAIQLRVTASTTPETKVTATVTVGSVSDAFSAITLPADLLPDNFAFTDIYNVAQTSVQTSNTITVQGINTAVTISVSGGEYSVDGGEFRSTSSSIVAGQTVQIRHKSASGFSSDSYTTVSIGNYSTNFHSRTLINPEDVQKFLLILPAILHLTLYP